jgi:antitoxin component YwqK of YwqJK toxin-antitoxin module
VGHLADGSKFKASFKNGVRHGASIEEDKDGKRFEGSYKDGKRDGRFVEKDRNGKITARGSYSNGRRQVD